ncbi:MAG: hypothetical protein H6741_21705 [Alphaproteobacteria bacterium]|nr:hypothetical protein [Alphaproteobacteria bacterium]
MDAQVIVESARLSAVFAELTRWAEELHVAYAWANSKGGTAAHWRPLVEAQAKLRRVVVGVSFAQTEPAALEALHAWGVLRVRDQADGTFHPKLVLGLRGQAARLLVGSSNLTSGGYGPNTEANVLLEGPRTEEAIVETLRWLDALWDASAPVDEAWLQAYGAAAAEAAAVRPRARVSLPPLPELPKLEDRFSPFEPSLPLERPRRGPGPPPTVLGIGALLGAGEQMSVVCVPMADRAIWLCGGGLPTCVGVGDVVPDLEQPTRWDVPVQAWADEDLQLATMMQTLRVEGDRLRCEGVGGAAREVAGQPCPALITEALQGEVWHALGTLTRALAQGALQLARELHGGHWDLLVEASGCFIRWRGVEDGVEQRLRVGPGQEPGSSWPIWPRLLDTRSWPGERAELVVAPTLEMVGLRFDEGVVLLAGSRPAGDVSDREPRRLALSRPQGLPRLEGWLQLGAMLLPGVRWLLSTPRSNPCLSFELERGFFEIANFSWSEDGLRRPFLVLNFTDHDDLQGLLQLGDRLSWSEGVSSVGRTPEGGVQAVAIQLQTTSPHEVVDRVHAILSSYWIREPRLGDVRRITRRFLMKGRGDKKREVRLR